MVPSAKGRRSPRELLAWCAVVVWLAIIWGHSLVPAVGSDRESLMVVDALVGRVPLLDAMDRSALNHLVRKAAHFTEYLVLGLLVSFAARPRWREPRERLRAPLVLWLVVPIVDEAIQLFVPGRAGMLQDVLLDAGGYGCGLLVWLLARSRKHLARDGGSTS